MAHGDDATSPKLWVGTTAIEKGTWGATLHRLPKTPRTMSDKTTRFVMVNSTGIIAPDDEDSMTMGVTVVVNSTPGIAQETTQPLAQQGDLTSALIRMRHGDVLRGITGVVVTQSTMGFCHVLSAAIPEPRPVREWRPAVPREPGTRSCL